MKFKNILYILFLLVLSLVYTRYQANQPREIDWTHTYSPEDKIPYGTYIVHKSLPLLFPHSRLITSRVNLVDAFEEIERDTNGIYISISEQFQPDVVEMKRLLDWTEKGNTLFVAAERFADTLLQVFALQQPYGEFSASYLFYAGLDSVKYHFSGSYAESFELGDAFRGTVLGGKDSTAFPDFVKMPYGRGKVYLNTNASAFINFNVLDSLQGDYYYKVLSCLPDRGGVVFWDAYRTLGAVENHSPLHVILRYPALQMALYLLLLGGLSYVFFRARREQRPIPVIVPPENRMLEFIATVSALYYKRKEYTAVALKQIDFFLGEVRMRYYLQTDRLDEQFVRLLSERSGMEMQEVGKLIDLIQKIRTTRQVDEEMLKQLMRGTEKFYKCE